MRVFFAIKPPASVHAQLEETLTRLKKTISGDSVRWAEVENLHITLQFLKALRSEHSSSLIEHACSQLKNIPTFQLNLGSLEWFPTSGHARIISLEVEPQVVLRTLSAALGQVIATLGYPLETRAYRGHMTLARFHDKPAVLLSKIPVLDIPAFPVDEIYLFESKPGHGGSDYRILDRFVLGLGLGAG